MRINNLVFSAACVVALCAGCQSPKPAEQAVSIDDAVAGLVPQLVQNALASRCFASEKPPVMAVGRIKNDTMMISGSLDLIGSQMVEMFSDSGRVVISSAFAGGRNEKDSLATSGQRVAPSLVLHGKLTQRSSRREDGGTQLEFTLALSIVDLASGQQLWKGSRSVCIAVDKNTPTW